MVIVNKQPRVVLVHGGFLGAWSWTEVATDLQLRGFMVIALELPSMGVGPLGDLHNDAAAVPDAGQSMAELASTPSPGHGPRKVSRSSPRVPKDRSC